MAVFVILPFFLFHLFYFFDDFNPKLIIAPLSVSTILGLFIGHIRVLKKNILRKEKLFHAIADEAKEFSYFKNIEGAYIYISPAVKELTGYSKEAFLQNRNFFSTLIIDEDKKIWEDHLAHNGHDEIEFRIRTQSGDTIWVNHNCSVVYEAGEAIGFRSVNTNITQRKIDESKITHMAMHDTLTKLPNRKAIFEKIESNIALNEKFSILFLDLNRFKRINDTFGHKIGDEILIQVANNLQNSLPGQFIGRLGGDEFIVMIKDAIDYSTIQPSIEQILEDVERDYIINDLTLYVGVSIGVSSFPHDATTKQDLLVCADKAMYKAKELNSIEYIYFKDIIEHHQHDEFILEKELRSALKHKELAVHFQPKINTHTNTIHSFEALIRWDNETQSIPPSLFIPIAEKTGLIKKITQFVIDEVFSLARLWQDKYGTHIFSINISVIDFMSDQLICVIKEALERYQVEPAWFELEITENLFLEKTESIKSRLQELIDMGFHIALDDFGTGYSSLAYLTNFPIKTLKIDQAFIKNLEHDYDKNFPLLKSIVTLAHELNLNIIAEGVETQKELETLQSLGCNIIQGHYFSKALPPERLHDLHHAMAG
jgi:diguanylate cyclase (GGDEF)-like protein/PAS domain S-box-containing protein